MLSLPIYLRKNTYYIHTRICGRQVKKSLKTNNKVLAIIRACHLIEQLKGTMDLSKLRRYEIDLKAGVLKSEGVEDHQRMIEALNLLQSSRNTGTDTGTDTGTASKEEFADKQVGLRLLNLLDKFFLLKNHLKQATVLSYKNTIEEFSEFLKNPFIQNIRLSEVSRFQEHLAKKKNQSRTIDGKIGTVRALMNFAIQQGYYFEKNPAQNRNLLSKKQKATGGYAIFEENEIQAIFKSEFLKIAKINDQDYYWTLVLALATGCRISEITSLKAEQFKISSGGNFYIKIVDSKTNAGLREIPYPDFLQKELKKFIADKNQVFKYKLRLGKGSGNAVGKKFSRHLAELKINREKLVFHSIRKFLNNQFLKQMVQYEPRLQFFGHEIDSVNIQTYSNKFTVDELFQIVRPAQTEILKLAGLNES